MIFSSGCRIRLRNGLLCRLSIGAKLPKCNTLHPCEQVCIDWVIVGQCRKFFKDFIDRLLHEMELHPLIRSETGGPAEKYTSKKVVIKIIR